MTIDKYAVLRNEDASIGEVDVLYDTLDEAREAAAPGNAIIEIHYEFADSELIEIVEG